MRWHRGLKFEVAYSRRWTIGVSLRYQETVSRGAKSNVMMESPPGSTFEVSDAKFILEFVTGPIGSPAVFREPG